MTCDDGFQGKVAFVTGGGSGIGRTVCHRLATLGSKVAIADLNLAAAQLVADEIKSAGGESMPVALDVRLSASAEEAVKATVARFGALNLAVNNAGVATPRGPVHLQSLDDWNACVAVNLTGVFNCLRAEIPEIFTAGGGSIVNLSSICGVIAVKGTAAYTAAKHGVAGLTKAAALDYAELGIRVNAVAPGYADTPLLASRPSEERQEIKDRHPMKRMASPQEIADLIVYLLSSRASFVTGSVQTIDGGYTAR